MDNAEKIATWRKSHPDSQLTFDVLCEVLGVDNLWRANLRRANLWGADLRGADLWRANLWGTDLRDANLQGANLRNADLQGANLRNADLQGANLQGANLWRADLWRVNLWRADLWDADLRGITSGSILQIFGLYPYPATLTPTPTGWHLTIGCWDGTIDDLRTLAAQNDGWPEATGAEILRRRPLLHAIIGMCETHTLNYPGLIERLATKWGTGRGQE